MINSNSKPIEVGFDGCASGDAEMNYYDLLPTHIRKLLAYADCNWCAHCFYNAWRKGMTFSTMHHEITTTEVEVQHRFLTQIGVSK